LVWEADFQGIYNIWENNIQLFLEEKKQKVGEAIKFDDINDPSIDEVIGEKAAATLREELDLVQSVYPEFNREDYMKGDLQPVFFGSALNNLEFVSCWMLSLILHRCHNLKKVIRVL
jgi:peptide chain release factor 3